MNSIEGILFILVAILVVALSIRKTGKIRDQIKERVNREYNQEVELSTDELEQRLGESEIMYEKLEQTYWTHVGLLVGISTHLYWHVWYLSVAVALCLIFVGTKYISIKPFSTGVPDRQS